jgi:hypothetical protein
MAWVFQLIGAQIIFAYILTTVLYVIWRIANPGKKW